LFEGLVLALSLSTPLVVGVVFTELSDDPALLLVELLVEDPGTPADEAAPSEEPPELPAEAPPPPLLLPPPLPAPPPPPPPPLARRAVLAKAKVRAIRVFLIDVIIEVLLNELLFIFRK
jgi:hypothetical protein